MVPWSTLNQSELGGLSVGPSIDSIKPLVFCSMLIVSYLNRVLNNQGYVVAFFAACNIDYFGISYIALIDGIFADQGGQ